MALLTESKHPAQSILFEMPRNYSRKKVTVLSGQNLGACAVVGRVSLGVGRATVPTVVGTGNGTMSLVRPGPNVEEGNYVVKLKTTVAHGGVFSVTAPSGKALPDFTLTPGAGGTSAYASSHISFSITDGSTDFIVDDVFTIVVDTTAPAKIGTGDGTVSAITLGPDAKPGNYRVECITAITNGGTFKIVGPDGDEVAVGSIVAGAGGTLVLSNQRQLNITITDGSTDFAVGDHFNVCVFNKGERGNGKVVAWDPSAVDGRQHIAGVLIGAVDASAADKSGVILMRNAIVNASDLAYAAAISAALKQVAVEEMDRKLNIVAN